MQHFVKLDLGSATLDTIPASLADRFCYDSLNKRLVYQGFMSKADFDRLSSLCDSWSYRRALEELFQLCSLERNEPTKRLLPARLFGMLGFGGQQQV